MVGQSVLESHIYVSQGLQRMGAHKRDYQWSQAVDLALTRAQSRVIKSRLKTSTDSPFKFEIDSKYTADIQPLICPNIALTTYLDTNTRAFAPIPHDFGYLLNDRSYIIEDCIVPNNDLTKLSAKGQQTLYIVPLPYETGNGPYYQKIVLTLGNESTTFASSGFTTTAENIYIVDQLINLFYSMATSKPFEVYWEVYNRVRYPNSFIIVSTDTTLAPGVSVGLTTPVKANVTTQTENVILYTNYSSLNGIEQVNADVKQDFLYSAIVSNYYSPTPECALCTLADNKFWVFTTQNFLVPILFVDYIRKPLRVNLALGQGLEIGAGAHDEVCDIAIQLLKKQLVDESYPIDKADNTPRIES